MIPHISHPLASTGLRRALLGLAAIGSLGLAVSLQAQSDNFNAGSLSPYWQHYDSGQIIHGYLGLSGYTASYTLVPDGSGGHAFHILCPADAPFDGAPYNLGPARALAFRADGTYPNRFSLGVDCIGWNNTIDQAFGPFWFIGNPGPGTTTGYSLTWEATASEMRISRIVGEQPTTVGAATGVALNPTNHYRFLATSHDGNTFLGQIFNDNDLQNPVGGVIAYDATWANPGGYMGLLGYDGTSPSVVGSDVTYDNYSASTPGANTMGPVVAHVSPAPLQQVAALYPTVTVAILNRDTSVDPTSVLLWMDGALISSAYVTVTAGITETGNPAGLQNFDGATVTYPVTGLLPWNTPHTNSIAYSDSVGTWTTNTWSWTAVYPLLHATNSLPLGSFSLPGWNVRMVWTNGADLGNSLARAEQQLAIPPKIPYLLTTQVVSQVLNWNDAGDGVNAQTFGYFSDPSLVSGVPGLAPDGTHDNIACECFAYLQLTAGVHRFGAVSDDGFQIRSGYGLGDTNATVLGVKDGGTFNGTFDFAVEADGLYPARCVWYENGGSANFQIFSVNLGDATARVLINDPNTPAGVVLAFLPIRLLAASNPAGPYATATGAVINTATQTVTIPMSGAAQFYRLQTAYPVRLSISTSGGMVVISYQ